MTKKLLSLMLAMLMLAAPMATLAEGNEPVAITFWHSMSENAGVITEKAVQDFNETIGKEKNIVVTPVYQGKYSDSVTKMNSVLSAKSYDELPDVMNLDATGKVVYHASGVAYTVDDTLKDDPDYNLDDILEVARDNWNFSGVQLGLPFAASTTVMFYNKTLLDEAGAQPPETLADIAALKPLLPEQTADGTPLMVYAVLPNSPTLTNWLGQLGSYLVDQKNGSEAVATRLDCLENGALKTFLTEWQALYASGALTNAAGSSDAFVTGQLAIYTTSSSNVTSLLEKIDGAFEMGVGYYPKVNADASFGATVSGSCLVMFDKQDDARKAAAWELVKYLTSADVQAAFAAATGYTPVNKGASLVPAYQDLLAQHPQYGVSLQQMLETPRDMKSVTVGPSQDFYYAIQDNISTMLDEGWDVDEAVDILAEELNGLLTQYLQANQ